MKKTSLLVFFLIPFCSVGAFLGSMPINWRVPTTTEITKDQEWRLRSADRYLKVSIDFNGDKIVDEARILVQKNNKTAALFAFFVKNGVTTAIKIKQFEIELLPEMGVEVASIGKYKTACGKGYYKCGKNEPSNISLKTPGISLFSYGKGNSFFIWNNKKNKFIEILISD